MGFEGASTYIDESLIEGVLAGIILLLLALWLRFANNWFWRVSFAVDGGSYRRCVALLGLHEPGKESGPRLTANGSVNGQEVALTIHGSYLGKKLVCKVADHDEQFISIAPFNEVETALTNWLSSHKGVISEELTPEKQRV